MNGTCQVSRLYIAVPLPVQDLLCVRMEGEAWPARFYTRGVTGATLGHSPALSAAADFIHAVYSSCWHAGSSPWHT